MPRTASFTSVVLQELLRQLEYAPDETHHRQMNAAEQLLEDIEPSRLYPDDFIVFRITSYRIDRPDASTSVVGNALCRDLVTFIQRLSWDLALDPDQPRGRAVPMDDVARRLGVSRRTLQRCRKDGLVMHWVRGQGGRRCLSCFPDALERFLSQHGDRIIRASTMSRMSLEERESLIRRARELVVDDPGASLNEISGRLAADSGRGHETIRRLLRRNDSRSPSPLFSEHGPLRDRDVELAIRARRRGVTTRRIADHFGKSNDAIHRAVLRTRRRRLAGLPLPWRSPGKSSEDILDETGCSTGLPHPACLGTTEHIHLAPAEAERDLLAWMVLQTRAAEGVDLMPRVPSVSQLDAVETDLRWSSMLHLRLVLHAWDSAGRVIEDRLEQPVDAMPRDARLLYRGMALEVICTQINDCSSAEAPRLTSMIEEDLNEVLNRRVIIPRPRRAAVRSNDAVTELEALYWEYLPWPHLVPRSYRLPAIDAMSAEDAVLVRRRYGLGGTAPCSLPHLAASEETTITAIERRLGCFMW